MCEMVWRRLNLHARRYYILSSLSEQGHEFSCTFRNWSALVVVLSYDLWDQHSRHASYVVESHFSSISVSPGLSISCTEEFTGQQPDPLLVARHEAPKGNVEEALRFNKRGKLPPSLAGPAARRCWQAHLRAASWAAGLGGGRKQ